MFKQVMVLAISATGVLLPTNGIASIDLLSEASIVGQVSFEKRVPKTCESLSCQRSQASWNLVITDSHQNRYQMNQPLSIGSFNSPTSAEVAGVTVQPGALIKMEGEVVPFTSNHFEILGVKQVFVLADSSDNSWVCNNAHATDPRMRARIWYGPFGGSEGSFKIRVQSLERNETIAFIDRANFTQHPNEFKFGGESENQRVEVSIKQEPHRSLSLPGSLTLTQSPLRSEESLTEEVLPSQSIIEMVCSRTR